VTTGAQLKSLSLPGSAFYPDAVDIQGTTALLGNRVLGRAMTFDWTTGQALQDLVPSNLPGNLEFGNSVAMAGKSAFVTSINSASPIAMNTEKLYEFNVIPEPSTFLLLLTGILTMCCRRRQRVS
jgi:hypothetical protein